MQESELLKTVQQFMKGSVWDQLRTLMFVMLLILPSVIMALLKK